MATINVKDAAGATVAIEKPLAPARAPAAASRPVVLSDEDLAKLEAIRLLLAGTLTISGGVTGTFWQATQPVSLASQPLPTGASTETTLAALNAKVPATLGQKAMTASLSVTVASDQSAVPISAASLPLPSGAATAANQATLNTLNTPPATGTLTSVAAAATDTTILAANANRRGATITNDSTAELKLLLSNGTSSATVFTVAIRGGGYYELPICQGGVYTGIIKGIWASATGNARVTEMV